MQVLLTQPKNAGIHRPINSSTTSLIPLKELLEVMACKYLRIQQQTKYRHATKHQLSSPTNAGSKVLLVMTMEILLFSKI